jgi:hypothetical protein
LEMKTSMELTQVHGTSGPVASAALLPWESQADYRSLCDAFVSDYSPQGATEQALVDRLVWIEWRRRRLTLAERAVHMAALAERISSPTRTLERAGVRTSNARDRLDLKEIVNSSADDDAVEAERHAADRKGTARALAILEREGAGAYVRAVAALHADTRSWWEDGIAGEYGDDRAWVATADCLHAFLRDLVKPADDAIAEGAEARPAIRLQAFGESFDPDRAERLMAIDARLDRQFEKALSMLLQLQQMRSASRNHGRSGGRAAICG